MGEKKIYILKLGSTYKDIKKKYGDFDEWIVKGLNIDPKKVNIIRINEGEEIRDFRNCNGVILTGSHYMVTQNKGWSVKVEKWIPKLIQRNIPLLGICYGHQLIAKSLNGGVSYNKEGEKSGCIKISLTENSKNDPIFSKLPKKFFAYVSHSQSVISLPTDAVILARDSNDSIYTFKIGECAWGVQFHPEFDKNIMSEYLKKSINRSNNKNKKDSINIFTELKETPHSKKILKLFSKLINQY